MSRCRLPERVAWAGMDGQCPWCHETLTGLLYRERHDAWILHEPVCTVGRDAGREARNGTGPESHNPIAAYMFDADEAPPVTPTTPAPVDGTYNTAHVLQMMGKPLMFAPPLRHIRPDYATR